MRFKVLLCTAAIAALGLVSSANATGEIIAPVSATIDLSGPGSGSIDNTFNQAGLSAGYTSGVTNFDAYIASGPIHTSTFACCEWFGNSGSDSAEVTYDFGKMVTIDALALWNEESSGIGRLRVSTPSCTFLTVSPFDNPLASYLAEVFTFSAVTTQFVTFKMSGCPQADPGSYPSCAIGEVAFRTAGVPEPTTWALMIGGFGLAGAALRRRRTVAATA